MKLSDAILLGATMAPQAFGESQGNDGTTCAVMAAIEAAGIVLVEDAPPASRWNTLRPVPQGATATQLYAAVPDEWANMLTRFSACPACEQFGPTLQNTIVHLNDDHRWTRENIAGFVAMQERIAEAAKLAKPAAAPTPSLVAEMESV